MNKEHPLEAWLSETALSRIEFARLVQISPSHLTLICQRARGVSAGVAVRIEQATQGAVRVEDLVRSRKPTDGAANDLSS